MRDTMHNVMNSAIRDRAQVRFWYDGAYRNLRPIEIKAIGKNRRWVVYGFEAELNTENFKTFALDKITAVTRVAAW